MKLCLLGEQLQICSRIVLSSCAQSSSPRTLQLLYHVGEGTTLLRSTRNFTPKVKSKHLKKFELADKMLCGTQIAYLTNVHVLFLYHLYFYLSLTQYLGSLVMSMVHDSNKQEFWYKQICKDKPTSENLCCQDRCKTLYSLPAAYLRKV